MVTHYGFRPILLDFWALLPVYIDDIDDGVAMILESLTPESHV